MRAPQTAFIGRQRELEQLRAHVLAGERLITVVGPGGIGKTRLTLEVASGFRRDFEADGGVWFVDLTEARTSEEMLASAAQQLGASGAKSARSAIDALGAAIDERGRALVVLDNCEHVASPAAAALAEWLNLAPQAIFVATSRERLRVPGEVLLEVGPLELGESTELFLDRARRIESDYARDADGENAVTSIARALDGMPLAIELAAARAGVLEPDELLGRLRRRFEVLAGRRRGPEKQRSVRATIDWSWDLLDPSERDAMGQLSVFRGGFDLDAAEAVLDLGGGASVLDVIQSLRDKSLLHSRAAGPKEGRLGMYVAVREYAGEKLADGGGHGAALDRHLAYFTRAAADWAQRSKRDGSSSSYQRLVSEHDNLVGAFEHALTNDRLFEAAQLLLALDPVRLARGPLALHGEQLASVIDAPGFAAVRGRVGGSAYLARGRVHEILGRRDQAARDYEVALNLAREAGDRWVQNRLLIRLGVMAVTSGRFDEARDHYEVAILLAQKLGDTMIEGRALANLGVVASETGELEDAQRYFERARGIYAGLGDDRRESVARGNIANVLHDQGRLDEASELLTQVVAEQDALGDRRTAAIFTGVLGTIHHEKGDLQSAEDSYETAVRKLHEVGDRVFEGVLLGYLSTIAAAKGDVEGATALLDDAEACLDGGGDSSAIAALRVHALHIDLARARRARADGQTDDATAREARIDERIEAMRAAWAVPPQKVRAAFRLLEQARSLPVTRVHDALVIGPEGTWFRPPGAARVDVARRHNLRRVLLALVDRKKERPGRGLSSEDLFAAGWPGERASRDAAVNRVRVAVATLRKLGLRPHLLTRTDGYLLDPDVAIAREEA